ncbi:hypothetical protein BCV71DRAFT_76281 [Rhizopus microsporus]|uniref:Uncharacterized protein n=1 Tax=Rhizopus microsporus TaxID=58291 RepID=A0A1X0S9B7_RHIZD|nr:hypothetical protein BCV71DRAFT_76281 [Rhizopus microsporus]
MMSSVLSYLLERSHQEEPKIYTRGKNYCLVHKRYFETSWCPDCGRGKEKYLYIMRVKVILF